MSGRRPMWAAHYHQPHDDIAYWGEDEEEEETDYPMVAPHPWGYPPHVAHPAVVPGAKGKGASSQVRSLGMMTFAGCWCISSTCCIITAGVLILIPLLFSQSRGNDAAVAPS